MIDLDLKKKAAAAAGYTVVYSGILSGWGCRWSEDDGRNASWGWNTEDEAWEEAFRHMCGVQQIYLHKKGGIYRWVGAALSSEDRSEVVVYEHLAPHAQGLWVRPATEFMDGRFERVTA